VSNYRIVRNTYKNGNVDFTVDKMSLSSRWVNITVRDTIEGARELVKTLEGAELVSSEVVE
jgi:hypothetical protein